ncbi:MAG: hypothetical protein IKH26_00755 [Bacteroidaceae bacterium]|nr:hypothetical protein [Bacteroidaceae bacterium]
MTTGKKTKNKYNKKKFLLTFAIAVAAMATVRHAAGIKVDISTHELNTDREENTLYANVEEVDWGSYDSSVLDPDNQVEEEEGYNNTEEPEDEVASSDEDSLEQASIDSIQSESIQQVEEEQTLTPSGKTRPRTRIRGVLSYSQCFPDSNYLQIQAANQNGVQPQQSRDHVRQLVIDNALVNITNSPYYYVEHLSHSMPYLVPKAQHLLNTIGMNFVDSLCAKGLPPHIIMVTSVLRTADDVSKLQHGNPNAVSNSCHCYGTTVDISYVRFIPIQTDFNGDIPEPTRYEEKLKMVLSEVLYDLRQREMCYVKYEKKQGCFHLTVR